MVDLSDGVLLPVDNGMLPRAVQAAISTALESSPVGRRLMSAATLQVDIHVTDDAGIRKLNRRYRSVDRATDVLSFPFVESEGGPLRLPESEPLALLGQIVLSSEYCSRQADELNHPLDLEFSWITIHGTLHLLGYDHVEPTLATHMESAEWTALTSLGFERV